MNMIGTPCSCCRFVEQCQLWKLCSKDEVVALGYCKQFAARNKVDPVDLTDLVFDLVVVYDEKIHSPSQLISAIEAASDVNKVVVIDVTGPGRNRNTLELIKNLPLKKFAYECLIERPDNPTVALDHAIKSVISPYFMAIDASMRCGCVTSFSASKMFRDTRNVFWKILCDIDDTLVVMRHAYAGLYVSTVYATVAGNKDRPFFEKVTEIERIIGIELLGTSTITYKVVS